MKTFFLQMNQMPQNNSLFYSSGKIYVVVVCALIIFLGIAAYLIYLDKKYSSRSQN